MSFSLSKNFILLAFSFDSISKPTNEAPSRSFISQEITF